MRTSVVVLGIVYSTYRNGRHFSIGQDPLERRQRNSLHSFPAALRRLASHRRNATLSAWSKVSLLR